MRRHPWLLTSFLVLWLGVGGDLRAAQPAATPPRGATNAARAAAPAPTAAEFLARARDQQQRGLLKPALEAATRAIEVAPQDPRTWHIRAQIHERLKDLPASETDMTQLIRLAPTEPAVWYDRGVLRLRLGDYAGSVADLDRYAELRPAKAPELWQRGIALFYAGRFDDGRRQFELHRTANPNDVENSAWHYCCVARAEGTGSARARWLPVEGDTRAPMAEIQELFQGRRTPEQLLGALDAIRPEVRRARARFYAHLYLALYHGALREREQEAYHAAEASKLGGDHGIMGEIAKLHENWVAAELRKARSGR